MKLEEAKRELAAAQQKEYSAWKETEKAKKKCHQTALELLGAHTGEYDSHYINKFAEQILEYANKNNLDPKWVYQVLHDAEYAVVHSHPVKHEFHPSTAKECYQVAMNWIFQTFGDSGDITTNAARFYLEKAIQIARRDEAGKQIPEANKQSSVYRVVIDLIYMISHAQQQDFWNHY